MDNNLALGPISNLLATQPSMPGRALPGEYLRQLKTLPGNIINASTGNSQFDTMPGIRAAIADAAMNDSLRHYRSTRTDQDTARKVIPFLKELGITNGTPSLSKKEILTGLGVTNLFAAAIPALHSFTRHNYPDKQPVFLATSPTYGVFAMHQGLVDFDVETISLFNSGNWRLSADDLDQRITEINSSGGRRVSVFYNINPHNPSGMVAEQQEIEAVCKVLKKHDVFVIDDLSFLGTELTNKTPWPIAKTEGMFDSTLTLLGLSKPFCCPAMRSALACGPEQLLGRMRGKIDMTIQSVPLLSDIALRAAFSSDLSDQQGRNKYLDCNRKRYLDNRNLFRTMIDGKANENLSEAEQKQVFEQLKQPFGKEVARQLMQHGIQVLLRPEAPQVRIANPNSEATYFLMLDFNSCQGRTCRGNPINHGLDLTKSLIQEGKVFFLPGEMMMTGPEHSLLMRTCISLPASDLTKVVQGIANTLNACD